MNICKINWNLGTVVPVLLFVFIVNLCAVLPPVSGAEKTSDKIKKPVADSITVRRDIQKKEDQWEKEKGKLAEKYDELQARFEILEKENKSLLLRKKGLEKNMQILMEKKQAAMKIQNELVPFLEDVCSRLDDMIAADSPFLKQERMSRMDRLKKNMADPDVSPASKYQQVMHGLQAEAEYGNTIEVSQEKILMGEEQMLGNVFRLGRVSLFFLSLDETFSAVYDLADQAWKPLAEEHLTAIRSAVKIGSRQQPAVLLQLPLGRLAAGEGNHE